MIKFVSGLQQVDGFLRVLWLPPPRTNKVMAFFPGSPGFPGYPNYGQMEADGKYNTLLVACTE
jgi:hypothetical protein